MNEVTIAASVLSILLGLAFLAIINMTMMAVIAQLTMLAGIVGITESVLQKQRNSQPVREVGTCVINAYETKDG
jgi:hypothetical protein